MAKTFQYFRPGKERRMMARCQFGLEITGKCSAIMTYPIRGYPWRRNPMRTLSFEVGEDVALKIFSEVIDIQANFPNECLENNVLWSDITEKANGITRDQKTNTLCHTISINDDTWDNKICGYSLRETSDCLKSSLFYDTISNLIAPYERLKS